MKKFVISYDLYRPGQGYDALTEEIRSLSGYYSHTLRSVWTVLADMTAGEIRDRLAKHLDSNDKVIVFELTGSWASRSLGEETAQWLNRNM